MLVSVFTAPTAPTHHLTILQIFYSAFATQAIMEKMGAHVWHARPDPTPPAQIQVSAHYAHSTHMTQLLLS